MKYGIAMSGLSVFSLWCPTVKKTLLQLTRQDLMTRSFRLAREIWGFEKNKQTSKQTENKRVNKHSRTQANYNESM